MKAKLIKILFTNSTKPHLISQEWYLKNDILYTGIKDGLLKGICFNSSSFSANQFEPVAFIQPLYIPLDFIALAFSINLKTAAKKQWWEYDEMRIDHLGKELAGEINLVDKMFLSKINNAADFYQYYKRDKKITVRHFQAVAYSCAYSKLKNAREELEDLLTYIRKREDVKIEWVKQIYDNTEYLLKGDASVILKEWEQETRKTLKL